MSKPNLSNAFIFSSLFVLFILFLQESNPWWQVVLSKQLYVESVQISYATDCCQRDVATLDVTVSTGQTSSDSSCTAFLPYGRYLSNKMHCSPAARGRYVTVRLMGHNITLVLCNVVVRALGMQHTLIELQRNK